MKGYVAPTAEFIDLSVKDTTNAPVPDISLGKVDDVVVSIGNLGNLFDE